MVESFRVESILNLKSNIPTELNLLGQKLQAFDGVVKASQAGLDGFERALGRIGTGRNIGTLVTNLERLSRVHLGNIGGLGQLGSLANIAALDARKFGQIAAGLSKIGTVNVTGSLAGLMRMETALTAIERLQTGITTGARATATAWTQVTAAINGAAGAMRGMPPPKQPRGAGGGTGGTGGSGGNSHSSSNFFGGQHQIANDLAMGSGVASGALRGAIDPVYTSGMNVAEERAKLGLQGFTAPQMDRATEAAFETQRSRMGTTVLNNIKLIGDIDGVIHHADTAIRLMPNLADSMVILEKVGKGDQMTNAITAAKAGELGGFLTKPGETEINPERWAQFIHGMTTAVINSHGQIGPQDFFTSLKGLGTAGVIMDPDVLLKVWPAIMQTLGASRAGTTLSSLDQSLYGNMPGNKVDEMVKMGLVDPRLVKTFKGGTKHIEPGGLAEADLERKNLPLWVWTVLEPLISKFVDKTVPGAKDLSAQDHMIQVLIDLYRFLPRNPQTKLVEDIIRNKAVIENQGVSYDRIVANDPNAQLKAQDPKLHQQTTEAALAASQARFGLALNADAVVVLDKLTVWLNSISKWAADNEPRAALYTEIAVGLTAVTTAMAALGVMMMVINPAVVAITAAAGGGVAVGAALAKMFPKDHNTPDSMWPGAPRSKPKEELLGPYFGADPDGAINPFNLGAAPKAAANTNAPGSSASNPVYNVQLNQPSGRDIANGVTTNQANSLGAGPRASTGFDSQMHPSFSYLGTP